MSEAKRAGTRDADPILDGQTVNLNSESAGRAQAQAPVAVDWDERVGVCDSYSRTRELVLAMVAARDPRQRLKLFGRWGNLCDAPWNNRSNFADILRRDVASVGLAEVLDPEEREWFLSLPEQIEVHRGCEHGRLRGLSWTSERAIAQKFARGMRCRNARPTLVSAVILKRHVLFLFLSRNEHEIVVDPRRLRQIKIEASS